MQQDDDIDEIESVRRYQEYKVEYKRTQINDFFVLHKNEEWLVIMLFLFNMNFCFKYFKKKVLFWPFLWHFFRSELFLVGAINFGFR